MLKKFNPKYSIGSLFICTKCGLSFDNPDGEFADKLKTSLRSELKSIEAHTKIRVMTSGCLGVCQNNEQAIGYYPHEGYSEVYTTSASYSDAQTELMNLIKSKI